MPVHYRLWRAYPLILWWCLLSSLSYGATVHDNQTWLNLTSLGELSPDQTKINRILLWLEGQMRYGNDSTHLSQQLVRTGLGYGLTKHSTIWVGYARIHTGKPFTPFPFNENRLWQQWLWSRPYTHFRLLARLRTEQRFVKHYDKTAYRIRGLFKTMVPFTSDWSVVASDELFWHKNNFVGSNGAGFDQNRAFIGLGYNITPTTITEVGYMSQIIRRFGAPNFIGNILSLNLYINW